MVPARIRGPASVGGSLGDASIRLGQLRRRRLAQRNVDRLPRGRRNTVRDPGRRVARSCRARGTSSPCGSTPFRAGRATTSCHGAPPTGGTMAAQGSVWLEAAPAIHIARADVVPHLDAVEVEVLISQAAELGGLAPPESERLPASPRACPPCCGRRSTPPASIRTTCSIQILAGSSPTWPTRCSSSRRRSPSPAPAW